MERRVAYRSVFIPNKVTPDIRVNSSITALDHKPSRSLVITVREMSLVIGKSRASN